MSLFERQWTFLKNRILLYQKVRSEGWACSEREVYRPPEMAAIYRKRGASKTLHSDHEDALAVDIYFRTPAGVVVVSEDQCRQYHDELSKFADYWKSLDQYNYWGGDWEDPYDPYHFGTKKGN